MKKCRFSDVPEIRLALAFVALVASCAMIGLDLRLEKAFREENARSRPFSRTSLSGDAFEHG